MTKATRTSTASPATAATRTPDSARRTLLAAPALLGLAALTTGAATPHAPAASTEPDAALLDLGRRFEAAWTAERVAWDALPKDDESSPAYDHASELSEAVGVLADKIENSRAATLPGLLVKARALRWNRGNGNAVPIDIFDMRPLLRTFEPSSEEKLIISILADLHALTGAAS